jgi:alkylation response protein AidB-like acyl-CoA dehydrogenase
MRWECERGCGATGEKTYASPADAARYAAVFDRDDREALARRPAMLSLLPLKLYYKLRGDRR